MRRREIEQNSKKMTGAFIRMANEMNVSEFKHPLFEITGEERLSFVRVNGLADNWKQNDKMIWELMSGFYSGLHVVSIPVNIVINSTDNCLGVYIGSLSQYIGIIEGMLKGAFPQIVLDDVYRKFDELVDKNGFRYGGYIKGNPFCEKSISSFQPIDSVINGMKDKNWSLVIAAFPESKESILGRQEAWMSQYSICSELVNVSYSEEYSGETVSYNKSYSQCKQYGDKVEQFIEKLTVALSKGGWIVSVNYSADNELDSKLLGALLVSSFSGTGSYPEPLHTIEYYQNNVYIPEMASEQNLLVHNNFLDMVLYPRLATVLNTDELAIIASFPSRETYGLTVSSYVEFDVNRKKKGNLSLGKIIDSDTMTMKDYLIDINELNRHCLIAGLTGSGKTNTIKSIIYNTVKKTDVPFLVIEPAKKEYWELYKLGFCDLKIYSVGSNEKFSRGLRINPFERVTCTNDRGVSMRVPLQTHIDFLFAAFKASFIMYTPMPYILEKAIYEIYEDVGWDIHNDTNPNGDIYPTLEDLYYKVEDVIFASGYDAKMQKDLIGSLQARINSIRIGSKGDTLNVEKSNSIDEIFKSKAIIELEDIGDDDVKAFIISILLIFLLEYRRQQTDLQQETRHLLLIEEAHRLLKNIKLGTGENADPRGAAVEFFCNLLAELRSKGQGFIVADQIPSKLATDLIKNTNLKIIHRTVAEEERVLVGGSMHMTDEQIDYLASLKQGVAAVYSEGDNRPILINPPDINTLINGNLFEYTREDVLCKINESFSNANEVGFKTLINQKTKICRCCDKKCMKDYKSILLKTEIKDTFNDFAKRINPYITKSCVPREIDNQIAEYLKKNTNEVFASDKHNRLCVLNCLIDSWKLSRDLVNALYYYYNDLKQLER